jgi:hypothetical protein
MMTIAGNTSRGERRNTDSDIFVVAACVLGRARTAADARFHPIVAKSSTPAAAMMARPGLEALGGDVEEHVDEAVADPEHEEPAQEDGILAGGDEHRPGPHRPERQADRREQGKALQPRRDERHREDREHGKDRHLDARLPLGESVVAQVVREHDDPHAPVLSERQVSREQRTHGPGQRARAVGAGRRTARGIHL